MKLLTLSNINYITQVLRALLSLALAGATACSPLAAKAKPATLIQPQSPAEKAETRIALQTGAPIPVDSRPQSEIAAAAPAPSLAEDHECADFQASLPKTFTQDYVNVPEDWNYPEGRKIRVFYYARLEPHAQPVVFFNGGPAGDSHSGYALLETLPQAHRLSFIYIDQRGTGCSDTYPASPPALETARRLTLYGTRAIVRDAEAIREKLLGPGSKWHAFGQSYGGFIVHRYLEIAPQSLSGAFAHGSSLMRDPIAWLTERLLSQKRVIEDYFGVYPKDRALLAKLRKLIADDRCFVSGDIFSPNTSKICGSAVLDGVTELLGFRDSWYTMHRWTSALLAETGTLNEPVLANFVRRFVFGSSDGSGFAASVLSEMELSPGFTDGSSCQAVTSRLESQGETPGSWPINECRVLGALKAPWNEAVNSLSLEKIKDSFSLEATAAAIARNPGLQFFLYSGAKDVFVPVATFSEEVTQLGALVHYRGFPESGHEGFYSEQQVWDDLLSPVSR